MNFLDDLFAGFVSVVPRGIVIACVCSAVLGLVYLLGLLFAIPNVAHLMKVHYDENGKINLAIRVFQQGLPQRCALAFTIVILINIYLAGVASMTVTSRIG